MGGLFFLQTVHASDNFLEDSIAHPRFEIPSFQN